MSSKLTLQEYFDKNQFVIPEYQRGYKWPVQNNNKKSSLEYFVDSLINAYKNNLQEYFIEAVTVVEKEDIVTIVDGQQRTTSLFLIFTVLKDFEIIKDKLKYEVREDSHKWLNNQISSVKEIIEDEDTQDIFYFKVAMELLESKLNDINESIFLDYIKNNIYLLYNVIAADKAINTFIALNGLKAIMKEEELIKSDLLIKSSRVKENGLSNEENLGIEWKVNEDRSRLARNWDKWLYWWNQEEVKNYYNTGRNHPLYYLLITYWNINSTKEKAKDFTYEQFKGKFIKNAKDAKLHFEGLRKLQKTFEDLYNNTYSYNFLGLILKTSNAREDALHYFLDANIEDKLTLEEYAKWSLIETTHLEIINNSIEIITNDEDNKIEELTKRRKAIEVINLLNEKYIYLNENEAEYNDKRKKNTFDLLLLLNLIEDNRLQRKFDFSIWNNRSLEHIYPKSKQHFLDFDNPQNIEGSIHCIGNLVLLYGRDNSSFGAKDFIDKKNSYFNILSEFKSRNLLHTISIFSKSKWEESEIIENKKSIISHLTNYYGI